MLQFCLWFLRERVRNWHVSVHSLPLGLQSQAPGNIFSFLSAVSGASNPEKQRGGVEERRGSGRKPRAKFPGEDRFSLGGPVGMCYLYLRVVCVCGGGVTFLSCQTLLRGEGWRSIRLA